MGQTSEKSPREGDPYCVCHPGDREDCRVFEQRARLKSETDVKEGRLSQGRLTQHGDMVTWLPWEERGGLRMESWRHT